jgi:hypothetical protein
LTHYVNPAHEEFQANNKVTVAVDTSTCNFHIFVGPWSKFTDCDSIKDYLTKLGLSFETVHTPGQAVPAVTVGSTTLPNWAEIKSADPAKKDLAVRQETWLAAFKELGYPTAADPARINWFMTELILVIMVLYVTMVYGPIAAFLVELFPTRIRYTSMSLPYHIGNGWFGGMLPLLATAMVASAGNIYHGLWYPIIVAAMTVVVGTLFLRDTKDVDLTR